MSVAQLSLSSHLHSIGRINKQPVFQQSICRSSIHFPCLKVEKGEGWEREGKEKQIETNLVKGGLKMGVGRRVPVGAQRNMLGVQNRPTRILLLVEDPVLLSLSLRVFIYLFWMINFRVCFVFFVFEYFCSTSEYYPFMLGFWVCPFSQFLQLICCSCGFEFVSKFSRAMPFMVFLFFLFGWNIIVLIFFFWLKKIYLYVLFKH